MHPLIDLICLITSIGMAGFHIGRGDATMTNYKFVLEIVFSFLFGITIMRDLNII